MVKIKNGTYPILTGIFMILLTSHSCFAQKEKLEKVTPFEIYVTQTKTGIDLVCEQGCAWQRLTFNTPSKYKPQGVNQLGMTKVNDSTSERDENNNFVFTIEKTNEGMSLSGLEGTAWESLAFSIKNGQKRKLTELGIALLFKEPSRQP